MPNHVLNYVTFDSRLDEIREYVKGENGIFDFNKIVPMPTEVAKSTDDITSAGMPDWYTWSVENWGTKWNCYEIEHDHNGFQFWTAWSAPEQMFIALSKQFPDVTITVQFADEDMGGGNCGVLTLQNGECEFTQGDYEFACELWGYEPIEDEEEEDEEEGVKVFTSMLKGIGGNDAELN